MPIVAAVIAAGATAYAANKQSSAAKKAAAASAANQVAPVDLQAEQKKALAGNLENLGDIEKLTTATNTYNQSQANSLMEQAIPGFSKLQSQLMSTAQSQLTNPYSLPDEVTQNLSRLASERGISAGTRGQFGQYSLLRDFGINSLQYGQTRINTAQSLASTLASISPRVNPMSPISMFVTPQQFAQNQYNQNVNNQATTQGAINANLQASNYQQAGYANAIGQLAGGIDWGKLFNTGSTSWGTTNTNQGSGYSGTSNAYALNSASNARF